MLLNFHNFEISKISIGCKSMPLLHCELIEVTYINFNLFIKLSLLGGISTQTFSCSISLIQIKNINGTLKNSNFMIFLIVSYRKS